MRKLIAFLAAIILGAASGLAAYLYIAGSPHPQHSEDSDRSDFDPGF